VRGLAGGPACAADGSAIGRSDVHKPFTCHEESAIAP